MQRKNVVADGLRGGHKYVPARALYMYQLLFHKVKPETGNQENAYISQRSRPNRAGDVWCCLFKSLKSRASAVFNPGLPGPSFHSTRLTVVAVTNNAANTLAFSLPSCVDIWRWQLLSSPNR